MSVGDEKDMGSLSNPKTTGITSRREGSPKTRPLGRGTVNLSVNMPAKMHKALKRAAKVEGKSLGRLCREILEKGLGVYYP